MTMDGAGLYYKLMRPLGDNFNLTTDVSIHFDNSKRKIDIIRYDNNYKTRLVDFIVGYRHVLFSDQLIGPFRAIFLGDRGMSDLKSFSSDNIGGIWMIKYLIGIGIQFYHVWFMNEINMKYSHSEAIAS